MLRDAVDGRKIENLERECLMKSEFIALTCKQGQILN